VIICVRNALGRISADAEEVGPGFHRMQSRRARASGMAMRDAVGSQERRRPGAVKSRGVLRLRCQWHHALKRLPIVF
jgi:hypothetical protein